MIRIPVSKPQISEEDVQAVTEAVRSGWVSSAGRYVEQFEHDFAKKFGHEYAIAVSNGTVGLHLALSTLGVTQGDEVIIPDLTFVATANAVLYTGAIPVCVDTSEDLCIKIDNISKALTSRTKAIIPVHLYGNVCEMDRLRKFADKHKLVIVEDCAEALGARWANRGVGRVGDFGVFSFYGNKTITTGEGGMVVTDNKELWQAAGILDRKSVV